MKIGVISDTHVTAATGIARLDKIINTHLADADLLVHAGDFTDIAVLDYLRGRCETKAVAGNMDSASVKSLLPDKVTMSLQGFRIGLTHGAGPKTGLRVRVARDFRNVDCIIFGHAHIPCNEIIDDVLLFNPGSALRGGGRGGNSVGVLELDDRIEGHIVDL